jgi:hypothetical protein
MSGLRMSAPAAVGARRAALWVVLVLVGLVALGVLAQVYLIASYIFGAGTDALDAHKDLGNVVWGVEVVALLAGLVAWWGRWARVGLALALPVLGTIQIVFSGSDEWVGGLHGLLALGVFALAGALSHASRRDLGLTRGGSSGPTSPSPPRASPH